MVPAFPASVAQPSLPSFVAFTRMRITPVLSSLTGPSRASKVSPTLKARRSLPSAMLKTVVSVVAFDTFMRWMVSCWKASLLNSFAPLARQLTKRLSKSSGDNSTCSSSFEPTFLTLLSMTSKSAMKASLPKVLAPPAAWTKRAVASCPLVAMCLESTLTTVPRTLCFWEAHLDCASPRKIASNLMVLASRLSICPRRSKGCLM
mmetsp:Transcript_47636/g.120080  ORF Transcript_47636/g.120080 Transcript_47636/m.120080 type:complete len:204 (-) Transcript_47636:1393-2004(-)